MVVNEVDLGCQAAFLDHQNVVEGCSTLRIKALAYVLLLGVDHGKYLPVATVLGHTSVHGASVLIAKLVVEHFTALFDQRLSGVGAGLAH